MRGRDNLEAVSSFVNTSLYRIRECGQVAGLERFGWESTNTVHRQDPCMLSDCPI